LDIKIVGVLNELQPTVCCVYFSL